MPEKTTSNIQITALKSTTTANNNKNNNFLDQNSNITQTNNSTTAKVINLSSHTLNQAKLVTQQKQDTQHLPHVKTGSKRSKNKVNEKNGNNVTKKLKTEINRKGVKLNYRRSCFYTIILHLQNTSYMCFWLAVFIKK